MLARLRILWRALTWPKERFYNLVELTYAGEYDEANSRFGDTGEVTTRWPGMVLVSYLVEETALYVHRPFLFLNKDADDADND